MRILLLGKNGQVGWELKRTLSPLGELVALSRKDLDLTNLGQIKAAISEIKPDLLVNAAAYTDVDKAENEEDLAYKVNAEAVKMMVEEAEKYNTAIVHYSTDYIFDGEKDRPYLEDDKPNPINAYGRSKLAGENYLRQSKLPYIIFRTSWIYGTRGKNFLLNILRLAREREELKIVDDQHGSPTWSRFIAEATATVLSLSNCHIKEFLSQYGGVYHLASSGSTTWYGFAEMILKLDPCRQEQVCREVLPIRTEEFFTPARRPKCSILNNERVEKTFHLNRPRWDLMLVDMFHY